MKVDIVADTFNSSNESTVVWSGELSCIPRTGDVVFFFDGWGGAPVQRVYWDVVIGHVEIHIDDRSQEYSNEAKRRQSV